MKLRHGHYFCGGCRQMFNSEMVTPPFTMVSKDKDRDHYYCKGECYHKVHDRVCRMVEVADVRELSSK